MTTSSGELFELCKQVYEATGWENTPNAYYVEGHHFSGNIEMPEGEPYLARDSGKYDLAFPTKWVCPLYTSDYLLEKLPFPTEIGCDSFTWIGKYENRGKQVWERADTPLKALLRLTLKLHEEEIL